MQLVLSSVHAVKGLECVVCFVVGLDTKAWRYLPCPVTLTDVQQASCEQSHPCVLTVCYDTSTTEADTAVLDMGDCCAPTAYPCFQLCLPLGGHVCGGGMHYTRACSVH